jgi:hypothetical protein
MAWHLLISPETPQAGSCHGLEGIDMHRQNKTSKRRKLNLRRETVRTLSGAELERVAGGDLKEGTDGPGLISNGCTGACVKKDTDGCQAGFTGGCLGF